MMKKIKSELFFGTDAKDFYHLYIDFLPPEHFQPFFRKFLSAIISKNLISKLVRI